MNEPDRRTDNFERAWWQNNFFTVFSRLELKASSFRDRGIFFYSEEILTSNSAIWFSSVEAASVKMVYATFDDSDVGEVSYNEYGGSEFPEGNRDIRYVKLQYLLALSLRLKRM